MRTDGTEMIPVTEAVKKDGANTKPDTEAEVIEADLTAAAADSVSAAPKSKKSSKSASQFPNVQQEASGSGQLVDINYALWLATVATSLMAIACLIANGGIYLLDVLALFRGSGTGFGNSLHFRLFELTALFSVAALAAHFLRIRLDAMSRAAYMVPLPTRIVANPPGGDMMSKFECSCKVTLAIDKPEPLEVLKLRLDVLNSALSNAFVVAVTDPVIRFSKAKMEQTLKVAAHHVLGDGVSGVVISDIQQRRVPIHKKEKTVATPSEPNVEEAVSAA